VRRNEEAESRKQELHTAKGTGNRKQELHTHVVIPAKAGVHVIPATAGIHVIPAKAGIHVAPSKVDPRFRGDDVH
jgi:hypothetical protein